MRRRMYYVMPDHASARKIMDDLLLARIEERHIHCLGCPGTPMEGLHEANVLQKTDLVHGAQVGLLLGALLGCIVGGAVVWYFPIAGIWQTVTVLGATIIGALFGVWASSMVASAIPNSRLRQFQPMIDKGNILVMVDVPEHRTEEIKSLLRDRHPEAEHRGLEPHIPAFP
jgi:hypothetical protein